MVHLSGFLTSIRCGFARALESRAAAARLLATLAILGGALTLAGCYGDDGYQLPTRAMKELSPEMISLLDQKNMPKDSSILVRIFKEESELEVWKQDTTGQFQLLKIYPICRWSGELGPKKVEGDRQAPEGFYSITPGLMNPNSNYYLAINTGFPNAYDKANGYRGAFLMIHGDCSSSGCYAMTDEQIGEIYSLARESFLGGQKEFQIQAYPFRMTAANLAKHRTNPNMPFWKMLKEGNDHFEVSHLEPKVDVCDKHYVFDAQPPANSTKSLTFTPTGRCPVYEVQQEIAGPALEKQRNDEYQVAQLTSRNSPVAPVTLGTDGGMNRVFAAKLQTTDVVYDNDGHAHAPPVHPGMPTPTLSAPRTEPAYSVASGSGTSSRGLFGGTSNQPTTSPQPTAPQSKVASSDTASQDHSSNFFGNLFQPKSSTPSTTGSTAPRGTVLAGLTPESDGASRKSETPRNEPQKTEPQKPEPQKTAPQVAQAPKPKAKPQQDAYAAPPPESTGSLISGAQPVVPTGSFDSRWAGLH
jgi:murein L,D-transpeptidase YafK